MSGTDDFLALGEERRENGAKALAAQSDRRRFRQAPGL
jgi:hypothetical protein